MGFPRVNSKRAAPGLLRGRWRPAAESSRYLFARPREGRLGGELAGTPEIAVLIQPRSSRCPSAFLGGIEFFCEGLRLALPVVAEFVAAPGCWVQPPLRMPGPAGPTGGPRPVDVLPVPALPWAKALRGDRRPATSATAITGILDIAVLPVECRFQPTKTRLVPGNGTSALIRTELRSLLLRHFTCLAGAGSCVGGNRRAQHRSVVPGQSRVGVTARQHQKHFNAARQFGLGS